MNDSNRSGDGEQRDAPVPADSAVPSGGAGFVWGRKPRVQNNGEPTARSTDGESAAEESAPVTGEPAPAPAPAPGDTVPDEPVPGDPVPLVPPSTKPNAPLADDSLGRPFPPPPVVAPRQGQSAAAVNPPEATDQSIPTMEEVLDAPSPRRAAREAAAREAAASEAGRIGADRNDGPSSATTRDGGPIGTDRGAGPQATTARHDPESSDAASSDAPPNDARSSVSASRPPPSSPTTNRAGGSSQLDSPLDDTTPDLAPAGREVGGQLMDAPASEWAASLRSATTASESAPSSTGPTTTKRPGMTGMQKILFWLLGVIIVVAIVILIVLLTTQQAGAAAVVGQVAGSAAQSMSTS